VSGPLFLGVSLCSHLRLLCVTVHRSAAWRSIRCSARASRIDSPPRDRTRSCVCGNSTPTIPEGGEKYRLVSFQKTSIRRTASSSNFKLTCVSPPPRCGHLTRRPTAKLTVRTDQRLWPLHLPVTLCRSYCRSRARVRVGSFTSEIFFTFLAIIFLLLKFSKASTPNRWLL
jgi:hypothetical protein